MVGSYERLKEVVESTQEELLGRHYGGGGVLGSLISKYEGDHLVRLGSTYIPIKDRDIPESVSREIGEAVKKLFITGGMRLDSGSTSNIKEVILNIIREHWSRVEYSEAKKKNYKVHKDVYNVKKEALLHINKVCDMCLLGSYDNPIKELRELRSLEWLKSILSQRSRKS